MDMTFMLALVAPFLAIGLLFGLAYASRKGWISLDFSWWFDDDDTPSTGAAVVTTLFALEACAS